MKKIVLLIGAVNSGKSGTLKSLVEDFELVERQNKFKLDGKNVTVFFRSAQEIEDFCQADDVIKSTNERLKEYVNDSSLVVIPYAIQHERQEGKDVINEKCILKPLLDLAKNYEVHIVYLRKTYKTKRHQRILKLYDDLMNKISKLS